MRWYCSRAQLVCSSSTLFPAWRPCRSNVLVQGICFGAMMIWCPTEVCVQNRLLPMSATCDRPNQYAQRPSQICCMMAIGDTKQRLRFVFTTSVSRLLRHIGSTKAAPFGFDEEPQQPSPNTAPLHQSSLSQFPLLTTMETSEC